MHAFWCILRIDVTEKGGPVKRTALYALLLTAAVLGAGARELVVHGAAYNIRTDVGIGAYVEADSFVLIFAYDGTDTEERIRQWLAEYSVFDINWRSDLESSFGIDLIGFTPVVTNSRTPVWQEKVSFKKAQRLLLLFVDEDIQFDDPFGYAFIEVRRYKEEEIWIRGVGTFESQKIGKVTLTLR